MKFIKLATKSTSGSTAATSHATTGRGAAQVARQVAGKLQKADLDKLGFKVPGNTSESVKSITFELADTDVFVSHKLGYRVDNFEVISPSLPAKFYKGSKSPNIYGLYVRSDTAGVTARVRVYGQRKG